LTLRVVRKDKGPEEWLRHASSNLDRAKFGKVTDRVIYEDLCFDAQQAAEKSLKAILAHLKAEVPMTHSIGYLLRLIEEKKVDVPKEIKKSKGLTQYAVDTRYPGPYDDVDKDEYEEALDLAIRVYDWAQKMIEKQ